MTHVNLTDPFVLSWPLLEAQVSGCAMVASDTAPVREVIRHGENPSARSGLKTEQ